MATLTVRDIAERVQRPGEDLGAVVDRLRNWTKEGLLEPIGERNPGTGRKRLYPEQTIIDAALLTVLTEAVGMPAVRTRSFPQVFEHAREFVSRKPTGHLYLVIGVSYGGEAT